MAVSYDLRLTDTFDLWFLSKQLSNRLFYYFSCSSMPYGVCLTLHESQLKNFSSPLVTILNLLLFIRFRKTTNEEYPGFKQSCFI